MPVQSRGRSYTAEDANIYGLRFSNANVALFNLQTEALFFFWLWGTIGGINNAIWGSYTETSLPIINTARDFSSTDQ
jgi:hypothetical protein